ncbi:MAG: 50S ribosomal protein L15 [Deltaproteobacteria bacterium]|nr:50S ribosomal protein L15 [Deltaproteobacteria bacterium]MBI3076537.1 50S ribosomal protein L15 [Deltaproteobacteria bacterium]
MVLSELKPVPGSRRRRKRVGRGPGSGHGRYATYGAKGQKARAGGAKGPGFEGGQMPLQRRVPKRGFTNPFRKEYAVVNLRDLEAFAAGSTVDVQALRERGLVRRVRAGVKVLAEGSLDRPLVVRAHRFSAQARAKIEAAGGRAEVI